MIHWQQTMIILFCLLQFGLAIPFPPSYQADLNTTSTPLSSSSHLQTAGTAASSSLFSTHPSASTKSLATNHTILPQPTFLTPGQPQWSPGDISTVIFGCIASILGILTLYLMLWLGWRGPGVFARCGMSCLLVSHIDKKLIAFVLQKMKLAPASPTLSQHPMMEICHSDTLRVTQTPKLLQ